MPSRFRGVTWHKKDKKWQAAIKCRGVSRHLGHFRSEVEAALAYDRFVFKLPFKKETNFDEDAILFIECMLLLNRSL